jgi:aspartyl-tRNA(Asn)/glutamyl-tRNA(Gln) amidotransferase subunit A
MQSARERLEQALARIADPKGEGARTCLSLYAEQARAAADASDVRARAGKTLGPMDGVIVTIKDLFDIKGEVTRAGSKVLGEEMPPAKDDAEIVKRLRAAGAVIVGKTNMSEFAFTGLGINPHFGTPRNPADRTRVPGGSSSGAAVAVADGFCEIGIGSDTGGSGRIPAALCGITGFKPSRQRVPTDGAFPLSQKLDSVGPLARNIADCAKADAVMAGEAPWTVEPAPLNGLRVGIAQGLPVKELDATVSARFGEAVNCLKTAGAKFSDEEFPAFDEMIAALRRASILVYEVYAIHKERLARRRADIDPIVGGRIEKGAELSKADYDWIIAERDKMIRAMDARLAEIDVLAMPTTAIVAPRIDEVADPKEFMIRNALCLRNTTIGNFFDLCGVSLPIPGSGLPVGLMLLARNGQDRKLLQVSAAVERLFA